MERNKAPHILCTLATEKKWEVLTRKRKKILDTIVNAK